MAKIILRDMTFHAYHGVLPEEKIIGTTYIVTLEIETDLQKASETDELDDTINYQFLYDIVKEEMQQRSKLIEHVAGRTLRSVKNKFPEISSATIYLKKKNPPIGGFLDCAEVVMSI